MGVVECRSPHVPDSCSDEREDMYARVLSHGDVAKSPSMSSSIPDHVHPIPVRSDARIAYKWVWNGAWELEAQTAVVVRNSAS